MNRVAAFALRRKNSILSMSEKMFCPPQPLRFWITPACAGKRRSDWIIRSIYWDHPRMCGEKDKAKEMGATTKGSPPRMRGKGLSGLCACRGSGITPAHAGKIKDSGRTSPRSRDHPRVCGEKTHRCWQTCICRDHPRACGEKAYSRVIIGSLWGSPPRMRGKATLRASASSMAGKSARRGARR